MPVIETLYTLQSACMFLPCMYFSSSAIHVLPSPRQSIHILKSKTFWKRVWISSSTCFSVHRAVGTPNQSAMVCKFMDSKANRGLIDIIMNTILTLIKTMLLLLITSMNAPMTVYPMRYIRWIYTTSHGTVVFFWSMPYFRERFCVTESVITWEGLSPLISYMVWWPRVLRPALNNSLWREGTG